MSSMLLDKMYKIMASFQNAGERIFFTFASLYADIKGASPAQLGVMLSLQNILAFIGQQYFGKASDKFGRPLIIALGWLISVFASILMLNFVSPLLIILTFAIYNIGFSMVQPAWNALIGDTYNAAIRAKQLGSIGAFSTLFGGLLYLTAGLLSEQFDEPFLFLFTISAITFTSALAIVIILALRNKIPEREVRTFNEGLSIFDPIQNNPKFRKFVFLDTGFAMAMSLSWPLFPRATNNLATPAQVTIIWFTTFLAFAFTARFNTQIKRYIGGYNETLFVSRVLMFTVPLTFAFATSWLHILAVRLVSGASFGLYSIIQKDYILETCEFLGRSADRGWFLGSHAFVWGVLTFIGSLFSGLIAEYFIITQTGRIGYSELFIVAAVIRIFAAFLFLKVPELDG